MSLLRRIGNAAYPCRIALQVAAALPLLALLLPLCIGVWLPDVWSGPRELAQIQIPSGDRFRVVQTWGSDFYTVELVHILPDGKERHGLIDGDAPKWWDASLAVNMQRHRATVNGISYPWPLPGGSDLRVMESR
jgi:hypothetical protein